MNVVVLDAVCENAKRVRNVKEGAALESCPREVPFLLMFAVGSIDGVLKMEQSGSNSLSHVQ